jgi:hypothetical protein
MSPNFVRETNATARGPQAKWAMGSAIMHSMRRMGSVIRCEIRLCIRAPALWIVTAIFALAAATGVLLLGNMASSTLPASVTTSRAIFFSFILLPFLFTRTFTRDRARRFSALLWTRPLAPTEYALGKGLANLTLSLIPSLTALCAGWFTLAIVSGTLPPPVLWLSMLPIVMVAALLATTFALLCIYLSPWPILGTLASTAFFFYLSFITPQTLLQLSNLGAMTDYYYSPSIAFGPDGALLLAHIQVYLALALLCLVFLALSLQVREHHGAALRIHWISILSATALAMFLTLTSIVHFQELTANYVALGPAPSPIGADVSHYQLAVTLNPTSGDLEGTATHVLTPSESNENSYTFALNPGLIVQHIFLADTGTALPYTSHLGWTNVNTSSTSFAAGRPITLTIIYVGKLALDRDDYAPFPWMGLQTNTSSQNSAPVQNYSGQGIAFLEGYGDWYPLPWTKTSALFQGTRQSFDEVNVRLPASLTVFCSLAIPKLTADGQWNVIDVRPAGPLPVAFLVALTHPHTARIGGGTVYYQGTSPAGEIAELDASMMQESQLIDAWLGPSSSRWIGVVVPFIDHIVMGPGLLLLPDTPDGATTSAASVSQTAHYRVTAKEVANAWWLNALQIRSQDTGSFYNQPPSLQTPNGRVSLPTSDSPLLSLLASYSAGKIASRILGQGFSIQELTVLHGLVQEQTHPQTGGTPSPKYEALWNQAVSLGIAGTPFPGAVLAIYHLETEIRMTGMTQLLHQFALQYAQQPTSLQNFITAASTALGHNFGPEITPFLPTNQTTFAGIVQESKGM